MIYHTPRSISVWWDAASTLTEPLAEDQLEINIKARMKDDSTWGQQPHEQRRSQDQGAE